MKTTPDLDTFTRQYIETALWSSTDYAHGECPCCGKTAILSHYPESEYEQEAMCVECGVKEIANPDPLDRNYSIEDIAPDTLTAMVADCADFQSSFGDYITKDISRAGHDFWLTRNGHGAGFWDGDWNEPMLTKDGSILPPEYATVGDFLTAMSKPYGSFDLYVGDDGMIHGS